MPPRPPRLRTTYRPILPAQLSLPEHPRPRPVKTAPAGIPFFRNPGHVGPTKGLCRSLLRATGRGRQSTTAISSSRAEDDRAEGEGIASENIAPADGRDGGGLPLIKLSAIRRRIKEDWRRRRGWTSIPMSRDFLATQYELLDQLHLHQFSGVMTGEFPPKNGDGATSGDHMSVDLSISPPFSSLSSLSTRLVRAQESADRRAAYFQATASGPLPRPHIAGFLRPTILNKAMPRLKPQPLGVSMMLYNRRRARERRIEVFRQTTELNQDMVAEVNFRKRLGLTSEGEGVGEWQEEIKRWRAALDESFKREDDRRSGVFDMAMTERVKRAKSRREAYKREKAEERNKKELAEAGPGADDTGAHKDTEP